MACITTWARFICCSSRRMRWTPLWALLNARLRACAGTVGVNNIAGVYCGMVMLGIQTFAFTRV